MWHDVAVGNGTKFQRDLDEGLGRGIPGRRMKQRTAGAKGLWTAAVSGMRAGGGRPLKAIAPAADKQRARPRSTPGVVPHEVFSPATSRSVLRTDLCSFEGRVAHQQARRHTVRRAAYWSCRPSRPRG
jgi:hypothetical protein